MTNIVLLVGNLGDDPTTCNTGNTDIANFNLGTSRPKRNDEGKTYKDASGFTAMASHDLLQRPGSATDVRSSPTR